MFFVSCNSDQTQTTDAVPIEKSASQFFPVTSYIKGQINGLKKDGPSPLKITTINGKVDSAWLKPEELDSSFHEFLKPEIDSVNMMEFFKESRFLDQTLNTFTFTYEPLKQVPETLALKRWDVYVNPETNKVKRVYLEKYSGDKSELQLSWQSDKSSRIVYLSIAADGTGTIVKEVLIKWNFDEE